MSGEDVGAFDVGYDVAFVDDVALFGADFDDASGESGHDPLVFAPGGGEVAEDFVVLVFAPDEGCGRGAFDGYFPQDLSFGGGDDGVGFGAFELAYGVFGEAAFGQGGVFGAHEFFFETLFGYAGLVVAVLAVVHGQFEEFFVVGAAVPAVVGHFLAVLVEGIGVVLLRVGVGKLVAFLVGQFDDFGGQGTGQSSALAEYHVPGVVVNHGPALFTFDELHEVHEGHVLDVLAEGGDEWGIAELGPDVFYFVEEHDEQVVQAEFGFALSLEQHVDAGVHAFEVGHHGAHHAAGQSAFEQQGGHVFVGGVHEVSQEVVDEALRHAACLHVGFHVDVGHLEAGIAQHGLYGDDVGVNLTPGHGFHGYVDDVGAVFADFEDGGHGEAGAAVAVVLDEDVGVFLLDALDEAAEHGGSSDAGHVFQADFGGSGGDELVGDAGVVVDGVDGGVGDAERGLGDHACLEGVLDGGDDVACLVQAAEDAGDVDALGVLDAVHEAAHVGGYGVHAQGVQAAVQHVCLYACFVEGSGEGAYGPVGVLAIQQVHLLEGAAVGLDACEATHVDDERGDAYQLVYSRLVFAGRLPHVSVDKAEFDFFFHVSSSITVFLQCRLT